MYKNEQNKKTDEGQITSFNEITVDPAALLRIDELDEGSLAAALGGREDGLQLTVWRCGDYCRNNMA